MISSEQKHAVEAMLQILRDMFMKDGTSLRYLPEYIDEVEKHRAQFRSLPTSLLEGAARVGIGLTIDEKLRFAQIIEAARREAKRIR